MILKKIKSAISIIRKLGLHNFIIGYLNLFFYTLIKPIFGFEEWHRSNPFHLRPYKKYVVDLINELNPNTTIEVGCGLGEMLQRVKSKKKIGIDPSPNVIKANRLVHTFSNTEWVVGDISAINDLDTKDIDVIFMIGWLHIIKPKELQKLLISICDKTKYLVVDRFIKDLNEKDFFHDFSYLEDSMDLISEKKTDKDDVRSYCIYKRKEI